ncbi:MULTISPECIES: FMN-binding protein [Loigolactobacillus]|uniref:FMN-binding protein n=1 Tax=Loigolactobacillus backii TaxID=375175 RepID=A0A192H0R3_9LACO|nr:MULTISPECIES: FMN-binding protein [Loigolactobacillus]ANK60567.1 FMN-binding protein [Loigolactobacillus backii]ANK61868.1 FMN-binding protein [Loigolactobacillus backii]ANK65520.1 FMN-binding protein [Loigolactobacillus backii]ANK67991.1 FMN-binding protein [Loigolactobacillus backii]ANK68938.1 FMN-binding protein [Loigolactobacillus backii]
MNQKFLEVMQHEGPTTIITVNAQPASVVNTWSSYVEIKQADNYLLIPAAGMHSIENDFQTDNRVVLTMGSKEVPGTQGPGAGFHVYGTGEFIESGSEYDEMKAKFPWIRKILKVKIDDIVQKI